MKILCITGSFLPDIGGMQFSTHQTIMGLVENGAEVTLICPFTEGSDKFDEDLAFTVLRSGKGGYFTDLNNMMLANKLFLRDNYEHVIVMGHMCEVSYGVLSNFLAFKAIILAAGTRLSFHNSWHKVFIRNILLCRAYKNALKIITISEQTARDISQFTKLEFDRMRKIPRPIDGNIWKPDSNRYIGGNNLFRIVTFSRLEEQKNIQGVLQILSKIDTEKFPFEYKVIGDGEYRDNLVAHANALNLGKNVEFLGYKEQDEISKILSVSDLHILLSKAHNGLGETFGRVYAEAGFVGVPSIGYDTPGVREAISEGISGYLFSFDETDDIKNKIEQLISNRRLLEELSDTTIRFCNENFEKKINWSRDIGLHK
ncbi:glycosyltransferase family 4 protein [Vibrio brasiliensis]|uniref:Glycosyl transferase n=1 Tax=Vibrio brasiliensis LMG 20546 TaxID=945543 RepID=E8M050_9VIBR|nr:glycosyltransferase family 4 protein [Vibrio brasiliensis]EGA63702.1 glycosyl transferase [Vibrio brasiliensis LMG 20546]